MVVVVMTAVEEVVALEEVAILAEAALQAEAAAVAAAVAVAAALQEVMVVAIPEEVPVAVAAGGAAVGV